MFECLKILLLMIVQNQQVSLIVPNNVRIIGDNSFAGCLGLNNDFIISQSVARIGENAFQLTSFTKIIYEGKLNTQCLNSIALPVNRAIEIVSQDKNINSCDFNGSIPTLIFLSEPIRTPDNENSEVVDDDNQNDDNENDTNTAEERSGGKSKFSKG